MKKLMLALACLGFVMTINAQQWSGKYLCEITKSGNEAKLELDITYEKGEYHGTLKGTGNEAFGKSWVVEVFGMENADYFDIYYNKGEQPFFEVANAHLFSVYGSKSDIKTSYGKDIAGIPHILSSNGFKYKGAAKLAPVPKTAASKSNYGAKVVAVPKQPSKQSSADKAVKDLLLGKWEGEKASEITKYLDYEFYSNGTGRQGENNFVWRVEGNLLKVIWRLPMSKTAHDALMAKASGVEYKDDHILVKTENGDIKVAQANGGYETIEDEVSYKLVKIDNDKLILGVQNAGGRWINTKHTR